MRFSSLPDNKGWSKLDGVSIIHYSILLVPAPGSGGGYFRLYPYAFTRAALECINRKQRQPFVFYLHPWEIDPDQPPIKTTGLFRFRHYKNLDKYERRLGQLLTDFEFLTVTELLTKLELLAREGPRAVQQ